jgi:hypothetical protein
MNGKIENEKNDIHNLADDLTPIFGYNNNNNITNNSNNNILISN